LRPELAPRTAATTVRAIGITKNHARPPWFWDRSTRSAPAFTGRSVFQTRRTAAPTLRDALRTAGHEPMIPAGTVVGVARSKSVFLGVRSCRGAARTKGHRSRTTSFPFRNRGTTWISWNLTGGRRRGRRARRTTPSNAGPATKWPLRIANAGVVGGVGHAVRCHRCAGLPPGSRPVPSWVRFRGMTRGGPRRGPRGCRVNGIAAIKTKDQAGLPVSATFVVRAGHERRTPNGTGLLSCSPTSARTCPDPVDGLLNQKPSPWSLGSNRRSVHVREWKGAESVGPRGAGAVQWLRDGPSGVIAPTRRGNPARLGRRVPVTDQAAGCRSLPGVHTAPGSRGGDRNAAPGPTIRRHQRAWEPPGCSTLPARSLESMAFQTA